MDPDWRPRHPDDPTPEGWVNPDSLKGLSEHFRAATAGTGPAPEEPLAHPAEAMGTGTGPVPRGTGREPPAVDILEPASRAPAAPRRGFMRLPDRAPASRDGESASDSRVDAPAAAAPDQEWKPRGAARREARAAAWAAQEPAKATAASVPDLSAGRGEEPAPEQPLANPSELPAAASAAPAGEISAPPARPSATVPDLTPGVPGGPPAAGNPTAATGPGFARGLAPVAAGAPPSGSASVNETPGPASRDRESASDPRVDPQLPATAAFDHAKPGALPAGSRQSFFNPVTNRLAPEQQKSVPEGDGPPPAFLGDHQNRPTGRERAQRRDGRPVEPRPYANPALLPASRGHGDDESPATPQPGDRVSPEARIARTQGNADPEAAFGAAASSVDPRAYWQRFELPGGAAPIEVRRQVPPDLGGGLPKGSGYDRAARGQTVEGRGEGYTPRARAFQHLPEGRRPVDNPVDSGDGFAGTPEQRGRRATAQIWQPSWQRGEEGGRRNGAGTPSSEGHSAVPPTLPEGPAASRHGLGSLSAKHESGRGGAAAIGKDSTGGWSYGTYQLAAGRGSMEPFLGALGRSAPEMAAKLQAAGGDAAARAGTPEFRAAWKALAADPAFAAAQHKHIERTHYDPLARTAGKLGVDLEGRTAALRDVVWSTAVQHGPGQLEGKRGPNGGADVLQDALRSLGARTPEAAAALPDEKIAGAIYEQRRSRFGNSRPDERASVMRRFDEEGPQALARIAAEKRERETVSLAQRETPKLPAESAPPDPAASPGRTSAPSVGVGGNRPDTPSLSTSAPALAVSDPVLPLSSKNAVVSPTPADSGVEGVGPGGGGTPLAQADRAAAQASTSGRQEISGTFQVEPIRVEHTNGRTGEVTGVDYLPVRTVAAPRPWGMPSR